MSTASMPTAAHPLHAEQPSRFALNSRLQWTVAVIVCALLAGLSLAVTRGFETDPAAWVVWARELVGPGKIATNPVGPGWKPLPVLVIAPFTLITRGRADMYWWLFLARFGVFMGVFAAATIARQFGGRAAGVLAAIMIVLSPWWLLDGISGRAEPLCGVFAAFAFLAHRRDRIRWACVLAVLAALIRPESWPFVAIYGVWLWRQRRIPFWYLVAGAVIILGLWTVPEWHHTGPGSLAADKNGGSAPNAAVYSSFPFWTVLKYAGKGLSSLPAALAITGIVFVTYVTAQDWLPDKLPPPPRAVARIVAAHALRAIALAGLGWVLVVAVMTQAGFSGSPRYLDPALMALAIVAAVVAVGLVSDASAGSSRAWVRATVVVITISLAWATHADLHADVNTMRDRQRIANSLQTQAAALSCPGSKVTGRNWFPVLAEVTGQSLPESLDRSLPQVYTKVRCASPSASSAS